MENEYIWIRLGFIKSESFDHELPLKILIEIHTRLECIFLICTFMLLSFALIFVLQNERVWPLKSLKKLLMARNSSQIQEKIQIHFEINFDKWHFILKYICSTWRRHCWDFDIIMTNMWSALNELSPQCRCNAKFCFFIYHLIGLIYWLIDVFLKWSLADRPTD